MAVRASDQTAVTTTARTMPLALNSPLMRTWKRRPKGTMVRSRNPRLSTRLSVPPKLEAMAAGLRERRSRKMAPQR